MPNWTSEYPTKPGVYWLRNCAIKPETEPDPETIIAELEESSSGDLEAYFTGNECVFKRSDFASAEWQGPIEPEE